MPGKMPISKAQRPRLALSALSLFIAAILMAWPPFPAQAEALVGAGQALPAITVAAPASPAHLAYLGLKPGPKTMELTSIGRRWLLIEVFSMYCNICQGEAERVNQLYGLLQKSAFKGKLALIGLGAGNSDFEVKVFRDKYRIAFPLFSDGGYKAHKALGEPRTPYFMLVDLKAKPPKVVWAHLGPFGQPEDLMKTLQAKTGLR